MIRFVPLPVRLRGLATAAVILCPATALADDAVRLGGTGMALAAMQQAGAQLSLVNSTFRLDVLPSLGTPGGLKALSDRAIDIAVVGRPLTDRERAQGARESSCLTTPLVFATSHPAPGGLAKADLPAIYANPSPQWPDGRPLKILLRSRAGSENAYLIAAIPGMDAALEAAYRRSGVPVATTDQENAELASRTAGSFAIMTLLQIRAERLGLRTVPLDGVTPSPAIMTAKTYPLSVQVCIVVPAMPTPAAAKFVAYLTSRAGLSLLQSLGAMPSK